MEARPKQASPVRVRTPRPAGPRLSVGFILARRFTLCAFANFVDVLRLAADEGDRSRPILCDWSVLSETMDPVPSSCGVTVQPNDRLGDPGRFDYIVVVGGLLEEIPNITPAYTRFLQRAAEAGVPLVGLCTGAFLLHRAGLMQGYRACVSWFCHSDFLEQFDGLEPVSDQIFVVDGDRLTCAGGASSAHLAAYLVEKHVGRAQASKSLHIMIIDETLRPEKPQPGIPLELKTADPMVRRALLLMQQRIDTPLSVTEIARQMGTGKRQLERHFRAALGTSPQAAFLDIRLAFARHLLEATDKAISAIAVECGFCDSSHLSRMFRQRYDCTPSEIRASPPTSEGSATPRLTPSATLTLPVEGTCLCMRCACVVHEMCMEGIAVNHCETNKFPPLSPGTHATSLSAFLPGPCDIPRRKAVSARLGPASS